MNANTLKAVTRHGQSLLSAFPSITEKDPVVLCKKLRRIEDQMALSIESAYEGTISPAMLLVAETRAKGKLMELGFPVELQTVFVFDTSMGNFALKLDAAWTGEYNRTADIRIFSFGGYGIIAPDLTTK